MLNISERSQKIRAKKKKRAQIWLAGFGQGSGITDESSFGDVDCTEP